ncbi:protein DETOXIFICATION 34 [Spinacia oleracea]|uniref:Protein DETOXIFICATION 34 n=1 Tax=Spinacia oleracea TaxID=3562 RepID=A0ABM3RRD5_SPIOL|nr:protein DETOXIFICATION 34-like [Spinacia oleracea]
MITLESEEPIIQQINPPTSKANPEPTTKPQFGMPPNVGQTKYSPPLESKATPDWHSYSVIFQNNCLDAFVVSSSFVMILKTSRTWFSNFIYFLVKTRTLSINLDRCMVEVFTIMNLNGWEGMLLIGINAAIGVRVSNELGSGNARAAKYSVIVIVSQSLYIESKDMQNAVAHLAYLLGITMVLNSVQPVISGSSIILLIIGVAVGGGWQALVAYVNLFSYYVIGLPLGFFLGYKTPLGVEGVVLHYAWYLDRNDNRN